MAFNFTGRIKAGYMTAFILLLFSYLLTFYTTRQLTSQNKILNHTSEVINNLEQLHSSVKDITIGIRGFIIMRDSKYLLAYFSGKRNVDSLRKILVYLTSDNPAQQERLRSLDTLVKRKNEIAESSLQLFRDSMDLPPAQIAELTIISKRNSDSVRDLIQLMESTEERLKKVRSSDVSSASTAIKVVNLGSATLSILLIVYSLITYNFENKAKKQADIRARGYHRQLEERIVELNRLNKELEELKTMEKFAITGRIARAIGHEVRNPLTNIGLAAEQLNTQVPVNSETSVLLEMVNRNVLRINQLITELLESSKFGELRYSDNLINCILDEALILAMDRIQLKKARLVKNYEGGMPKVSIDADKMKVALLNIIVNALEAMPDEIGVLSLKTEEFSGKCIVTISDNGIGMDKETISKIFEPYFTNKIKGNGLGLTHTQNIILNHKGTIEVKSELGKGSSFMIALEFA
jgi:signal transduction histidine kinase